MLGVERGVEESTVHKEEDCRRAGWKRRRGGPTTEETPVTTANIDQGYTRVDIELAIHL